MTGHSEEERCVHTDGFMLLFRNEIARMMDITRWASKILTGRAEESKLDVEKSENIFKSLSANVSNTNYVPQQT